MQEHRTAGTNYKSGGISVWKQVWRLLLLLFQCPSLSRHPRDGHLSNWRWEEDIMLEPPPAACSILPSLDPYLRHASALHSCTIREGCRYTKMTFLQVFPQIPLLWSIIRHASALHCCTIAHLCSRCWACPWDDCCCLGGCRQSWQISRLQIWKIQQGNNIQVRILFAIYWLLVCLLSCSQTDWIRQSDLVQDTPLLQKESFTKWEFQHLQSCSFSVYL